MLWLRQAPLPQSRLLRRYLQIVLKHCATPYRAYCILPFRIGSLIIVGNGRAEEIGELITSINDPRIRTSLPQLGHGKSMRQPFMRCNHETYPTMRRVRMTLINTAHANNIEVTAATKVSLNPGGSYVNLTDALPAGQSMAWKTPSEMPIGAGLPLTVADHPCINSSRVAAVADPGRTAPPDHRDRRRRQSSRDWFIGIRPCHPIGNDDHAHNSLPRWQLNPSIDVFPSFSQEL
jgi:hypothetical protein